MDSGRGFLNARQIALGDGPDQASDAKDARPRQQDARADKSRSSLEQHFDPAFATRLALREKQIQHKYRPIIGIRKGFAHQAIQNQEPSR